MRNMGNKSKIIFFHEFVLLQATAVSTGSVMKIAVTEFSDGRKEFSGWMPSCIVKVKAVI